MRELPRANIHENFYLWFNFEEKEEYYSTVLMNKGINSNSLAEITAAFLGVSKKKKKDKDAQVISKLEEIIAELRMDNEKDM